ncbi:MAG: polyprenyl synthetase family protein [Deltaproteobacteria bacterium]|nr:polyprenyl synthetase family protein [Deltaproteobacteria bacterium]
MAEPQTPPLAFEALVAPHLPALELRLRALAAADSLGLPQRHTVAGQDPVAGAALLRTMADQQLATGGKRLRGVLPMAVVAAADGPTEAALALGAAVELVHNGTLVHDDVQDNDRLRRGQPTLWTVHGVPQAINAGDALLVAPLAMLIREQAMPPGVGAAVAAVLAEAIVETIRGQVADIALRDHPRPGLDDLIAVHLAKTAPLFGACLQGSALLLRLGAVEQAHAQGAARALGLAFQVRDDLLDMAAAKGRGSAGADLREGKWTAPVLLAADRASDGERNALREDLARAQAGGLEDAVVERWVQWTHDCGGVGAAQAWLDRLLTEAEAAGLAAFGPRAGAVVAALARRLARVDG